MNILFAASEAFPFIKTGGLGDIMHSLPVALKALGEDVRMVLPAYRDVLAGVEDIQELGYLDLFGAGVTYRGRVLQAHQDELGDYLYLVDVPELFDRPGNPYVHMDGFAWPDNAERFTVFSRAVAQLARGIPGENWVADVVHCHDWQTGLVPAFLHMMPISPYCVFTIHNLAYDGFFSQYDFNRLGLPPEWWTVKYAEFFGGFSMLKSGMMFSDSVTTVSPNYAKEICTPEFGNRFDGVLRSLGDKLSGILNGIDLDVWNPETDKYLNHHYSATKKTIAGKLANKNDLLKQTGLEQTDAPVLGFIGRLVEQKGVDLITTVLPELFDTTDISMVLLGSGHMAYEADMLELAQRYPGRMHTHIGYSEELAHRIEAGADIFLMPSRFEPCGLNQMYSLRYGTPPVVNHTGGLADTVVDTTQATLRDKTANGFVFHLADADAFMVSIQRALTMYSQPRLWQQICKTAMQGKLGWEVSALKYQALYQTGRAAD
jgi:starch synthase